MQCFEEVQWPLLVNLPLTNCYTSLAYSGGGWGLSHIMPSHELKRMMILLKQFRWVRLVMQNLLASHGMFTIGILNYQVQLKEGNANCVWLLQIKNDSRPISLQANSFFNIVFPSCIWIMTLFIFSLGFKIPQKRPLW